MRSLFGNRPSKMFHLLVSGLSLVGGAALADEPLAPSDALPPPAVVTQSTTTTITTAPAVTELPPPPTYSAPPMMAAPPLPMAPPPFAVPMGPPPATGGMFQGPVYYNGPVWIIPAQPGSPPPSYAPPPYYAPPPPTYYAPPPRPYYPPHPIYRPQLAPLPRPVLKPKFQGPRGPVVGLGVRFTALGVTSQQVFGQDVNLMGGGLMMRFRSQGRFGFELGMDVLRADLSNSAFVRTSYPFTVSPMFYIFENRPENHFNIYGLAGFGLMADDVSLYKGSNQERNQQFWEVMGQAGAGIELRFTHFALFSDIRAVGMLLDNTSAAGTYYQNVDGGPIAGSSYGYKFNAGALMWF